VTAKGRTKGVEATTRRDYRIQLVTERLTGAPAENDFVSKDMQWGTEQEPFGRMAHEAETGEIVREAGFAYLPDMPVGCSVDGFIDGGRGFMEIKCPKSSTHINWLQEARLPPEHVPQTTHNFFVTDCEFVDFVSFDPRLPEYLRLFIIRVYRNEVDLKEYEAELRQFLSEVDALEQRLRARAPMAKAA
jgi:hypothetical protein